MFLQGQIAHNKNKIRGHCRRGMLELDIILSQFFADHYDHLNEKQQCLFSQLLQEQDPTLYRWFLGYEQPEDKQMQTMVSYILSSRKEK